jgi:hypothetical protein
LNDGIYNCSPGITYYTYLHDFYYNILSVICGVQEDSS